jgi:hypothetical protein
MTDSNYKLKKLYNGVYGYTNAELTDKKAKELIKRHPLGIEMFCVLPPELQKKVDEKKAEEVKAIEEKHRKYAEKVKADKAKQLGVERKAIAARQRPTMIDLQNKSEEAVKEAQANSIERRELRMKQLLEMDRKRLVYKIKRINKVKSLSLSTNGSTEEIAKRIFNNE